ncbi:MAG: DUF3408 domain-containing protein [Dysgonomonas sp.]
MEAKKKEEPGDFNMENYINGYSNTSQSADSISATEQVELNKSDKSTRKTVPAKQRKLDLQEYKETFLSVPRIIDRRTVFISNDIREQAVSIVRKLGEEKASVSGFIENLLRHHLEVYREDVEKWIHL